MTVLDIIRLLFLLEPLIRNLCYNTVDDQLYQYEKGKVKLTQNKEKERIKGTDLGDHVTTHLHCSHLYEQKKDLNSPLKDQKVVI